MATVVLFWAGFLGFLFLQGFLQSCRRPVRGRTTIFLKASFGSGLAGNQHLLVFLEKAGWLKELGPFCFALQNLVCDAEACRRQSISLSLRVVELSACVGARVFTVFELLGHDSARGRGHVVGGVLLWVGRCDDGHQVVSVRWVHLNPGNNKHLSFPGAVTTSTKL